MNLKYNMKATGKILLTNTLDVDATRYSIETNVLERSAFIVRVRHSKKNNDKLSPFGQKIRDVIGKHNLSRRRASGQTLDLQTRSIARQP